MHALAALLLAVVLVLPGCVGRASDSQTEWDRAQCNQIIDRAAREKCLERLGFEDKPERERRR